MKKLILITSFILSAQAFAQDCMIGEVKMFAGNFAPRGWAKLEGQLLPISSNSALFSILGTQFGGDGRTTFALPDMRGRSAIGTGQGDWLRNVRVGQKLGTEKAYINSDNLPNISGSAELTVLMNSASTVKVGKARGNNYVEINVPQETQTEAMIQFPGDHKPIDIRQPSLGINHIICLQGYYPSRS